MDASDRRRLDGLLARLADGDRSAFDPLFDLCAPLARRYADRALAGAPDAEDVAQTALLKLFARAAEYEPSRPALPWIVTIVANEVRTHRRRAQRRREEPLVTEPCLGLPTPEETALERELIHAVEVIAMGLTAQDREAIEVAIGIGERPPIAATAFRKRLSRALARLRHAWKEVHDGG